MLTTQRDHNDLRQLLLRIIREGGFHDCADVALEFALDPDMDPWTRVYAIQAFGKIGTASHHDALRRAILTEPATLTRQILASAIESLFPQVLSVADVTRILKAAAVGGGIFVGPVEP